MSKRHAKDDPAALPSSAPQRNHAGLCSVNLGGFMAEAAAVRVPRTRSSHKLAEGPDANFGFKSGTPGIESLMSLSIPKFV